MPICIPPPYNVFAKQPHEMLCSSIWCHDKCLKLSNLQRKDISHRFELGNLRPRCLDVVSGDGLSCAHVRSQKGQRETASIRLFCNSSIHSLGQNPGVLNTSPSAPLPTVLQWGLSFRHSSWELDTFRTQRILTQDSRETKPKGTHFFPQMAKLWQKM